MYLLSYINNKYCKIAITIVKLIMTNKIKNVK